MDILNKEKIERLSNEIGADNLPVLLDIFLSELSLYKKTLLEDETVDKEKYLREISHALKSSAASFGADRLCHVSIDMDARIKAGEALNPVADLEKMVQHLEETRETYQALVAK
ncbi:Hpt domain-containing protein [Vibrio sp. ZSDE26]|uniref:Phosphorelay protein LuxU n=1 Tax=Vibrio amylolyticus TaxID=2847292 RepID=A0A9X1XHJ1_9VIBR|nr:quorum-sensing phosphorelay protein LuxU [Vibrio amylolyticus]MCK6262155.1 Hpt domain-containing protein [Vibrio amylolyticus]